MRKHRTDYRLWAIAGWATFAALWLAATAWVLSPTFWSSTARILGSGDAAALDRVILLAVFALCFAAASAPIGWVVQAVAVLCGLSLSRPRPEQAPDYDDTPRLPPTG
jgi:hypothetical protein